MSSYNVFIVVNGQEFQMVSTSEAPTYDEVYEGMSVLKEVENIKVELVNGDILAINGVQYKDVYFLARKEGVS